jgi:hypothetical protein
MSDYLLSNPFNFFHFLVKIYIVPKFQSNPGKIPIVARSFENETNQNQPDEPEEKTAAAVVDGNKDAQSDREILESIQPEYFQESGFDPSLFELKVPCSLYWIYKIKLF